MAYENSNQNYQRTKMQKDMIIKRLREEGCRITKQRRMLLDVILEEECSCCKEIYYRASKVDPGIGTATVYRMVNKLEEIGNSNTCKDARMIEIMNYIQENYIDITLDDLAEKFFLSKPYISKYIKEKSGVTFGELVKKIRMKKARALLKSSNMTVENIALSVGYQNVEHFNRLFKKAYNMTPIQFRNEK